VIHRDHACLPARLTFPQLRPIAEGVEPASLQHPRDERRERERKGERGKRIRGSDCEPSPLNGSTDHLSSQRGARERIIGIERCRAVLSGKSCSRRHQLIRPSSRPPFSSRLASTKASFYGRFVSPGDHNSRGISGGSPRRVAPTYFPVTLSRTGVGKPSLVRGSARAQFRTRARCTYPGVARTRWNPFEIELFIRRRNVRRESHEEGTIVARGSSLARMRGHEVNLVTR